MTVQGLNSSALGQRVSLVGGEKSNQSTMRNANKMRSGNQRNNKKRTTFANLMDNQIQIDALNNRKQILECH